MKTSHLILFFAAFLISCSDNSTYKSAKTFDIASIKEVGMLHGDSLRLGELKNPKRIQLIDSLLLLTNHLTDKLIEIYNLKDGGRTGEFLNVGRAANELLSAQYVDYSVRTSKLWITDIMTYNTLVYESADLSAVDSIRPVLSFQAPQHDNILFLSSGEALGLPTDYTHKHRVSVLDASGAVVRTIGGYPEYSEPLPETGLSDIFQSRLVVSSDEKRVAVFNRNTDLIELYDIETGTVVKLLHGPDKFFPIYKMAQD